MPSPTGERGALRILTWNVWFGEWARAQRWRALWTTIERLDPDVICLQEVVPEHLHDLAVARRRGYRLLDEPHQAYDVVLLTRAPVRAHERVWLPSEMGRNLLVARLDTAPPLTVATVHLESTAPMERRRAQQLERIRDALARDPDAVLVGDMNITPGDVCEPALVHGWRDAWTELRPGEPGYTVDAARNEMRRWTRRDDARKRIDRVLTRGDGWRPAHIERVGLESLPSDPLTYVSDHFGLHVELVPRTRGSCEP